MRFLFSIGIILGLSMAIEVAMVPLAKTKAAEEPGLVVRGMPTAANHLRGFLCDICIDFGAIVKQAYESMETEAEVAQLMKVIFCDRLGDSQSLCNMWIDSYVPVVMRMLANNANSRQICISTKFCPATVTAAKGQRHRLMQLTILKRANAKPLLGSNRCTWGPSYWCSHVGTMKECRSGSYCSRMWQRGPAVPSSSEDCGFCRLLASDLERLARANRTSGESRRLATSACGLVPERKLRSLCLAVVDNYIDEAIQLLRDGLTTDRLCSALSLCGGRRDPKLHVAMETPAKQQPPVVRVPLGKPLLRGSPLPPVAAGRLRSGACDLCVDFVAMVKLAAENKQTEAEVTQLMKEAVCSRLSSGQSLCNLWIDSYVPEVMRKLANKMDPRQVCAGAKFCPAPAVSKYQRHPLMQLMLLQKSDLKPLRDVECQVCEMLVSEARQMLRDNKTQEEIIQFIRDRVCSLVPAEKDKCIRAVTEYGPVIFQLLASELDPNSVCQALGACGKAAARSPRLRSRGSRPRIGPQCLLCEYVMRELDQLLGSNRSVAAIESALETVCSIMPLTVRKDCDDWVLQYTPVVLQLLSQDLSPAIVCTVLGLCTGVEAAPPQQPLMAAASSATACDVCQTVILYVKSLLNENATEQEVMNVLEKVCNFLPTQEQPACRAFVEQYTPYIIQLLLQDVNPKEICQTLGLCPKAAAAGAPRSRRLRYRANDLVEMQEIDDPLV